MAARLSPGGSLATRASRGVRLSAILAVGLTLAACGTARRAPTYPPAGSTPQPATGQTDATAATVSQALSAAGLGPAQPDQPYQPPEGAWFASAPRSVIQITIAGESSPRFVVVYGFATPADATTAAQDQASYVGRGAGAVDFPNDTRFTLRIVGSDVVFFAWSPSNADPKTMTVETALDTLGTGVEVP